MADIWKRIREVIEEHGGAVLVSVIGVAGSVPRGRGARMVVRPDGGFFGTIGGGRLEYEVLACAREALAAGRGKAQFRDWPLGPNLGQCCGGMVTTLTETFDPNDLDRVRKLEQAERAGPFVAVSRLCGDGRIVRMVAPPEAVPPKGVERARQAARTSFDEVFGEKRTPLLLFGAGHVGRALVLALAPLPFAILWIDSRADQFPQHMPGNVTPVPASAPEHEIAKAAGGAFVVIMTHSHPLDLDITVSALKRSDLRFIGLIGSDTKRARFVSQARHFGVAEADLKRLICPIGLREIKGKELAVIAAAVAAQLLIAREG
jgi:xanthine dehydrogenase accessory factor